MYCSRSGVCNIHSVEIVMEHNVEEDICGIEIPLLCIELKGILAILNFYCSKESTDRTIVYLCTTRLGEFRR